MALKIHLVSVRNVPVRSIVFPGSVSVCNRVCRLFFIRSPHSLRAVHRTSPPQTNPAPYTKHREHGKGHVLRTPVGNDAVEQRGRGHSPLSGRCRGASVSPEKADLHRETGEPGFPGPPGRSDPDVRGAVLPVALIPPSSFRRKPESRCRTGHGIFIGPCPSIVIPAKAGIQRSPRTGDSIGPCTPLPIPSGYGGRIGRATDTTPQEDESRRNAFVCARRCSSAKNVTVEFLEDCVEQPFRRTFHLILPVGAGLFQPRVPLPPLRPRRDVSREGYISRQRLRDPECQGRRLSNDLREGRIPFRGPRRETDLSENFGPGSSACTGEFPPRTCSVDLHSSVVFSVP